MAMKAIVGLVSVCWLAGCFSGYLMPREALFSDPDIVHLTTDAQVRYASYFARRRFGHVFCISRLSPTSQNGYGNCCRPTPLYGIMETVWLSDGRTMLLKTMSYGNKSWALYTMNMTCDRKVRPVEVLSEFQFGSSLNSVSETRERPNQLLLSITAPNCSSADFYILDLNTLEKRLIFKNDGYFLVSFNNANELVYVARQSNDGWVHYYRVVNENDSYSLKLYKSLPAEVALVTVPLAFRNDDRVVYWMSSEGRDKTALVAEDVVTHFTTVIAEGLQSDIEEVVFHPIINEPLIVSENYFKPTAVYVDDSVSIDHAYLMSALQPNSFKIVRISEDMQRWLLLVFSDVNPGTYYLYCKERGHRQLTKLFHIRKSVLSLPLVHTLPIQLETRDGFRQVCMLTLPRNETNGSVPLVNWVHGGPQLRVKWSFNPTAQLFANRGYAVLECNFRGSTGYGRSFLKAGHGEWCNKMQDDIMDASLWAVESGLADAKRLAIGGFSYGGYATLCAMVNTPDFYACGIDAFGPSNLITLFEEMPLYWETVRGSMTIQIGADIDTPEQLQFLRSRSPYFKAHHIKKPLLIMHGVLDDRVPVAESDRIIEALADSGTQVTYLLFPFEGHGLTSPEHRMLFYGVAEQFLAKNCLGGAYQPVDKEFKFAYAIFENFPRHGDAIVNATDTFYNA